MLIAKIAIAAAAVLAASVTLAAEGDPISEAEKPVLAAARIFALLNGLHGDIGVADEDEAHIGEKFEVNHAVTSDDKIDPCSFTLRRRDGPIVEQISFDQLSAEASFKSMGPGSVQVHIPGRGRAVCEIENEKIKECSSSLDMLLAVDGDPAEITLARRALSYIASNVCRPTELPF